MRSRFLLPLAAALLLAGCSSNSGSGTSGDTSNGAAPPSFNQFTDIPIPENARLSVGKSLVLGQGDNWVGRLDFSLRWSSAPQLFDFYKAQMPTYKWTEISSVRADISVMTYRRGDRIATVQIEDTTLGAEVIITMGPANGAPPSGGFSQDNQPQPPSAMPAPPPAVTSQPLNN
ncbi:MAG TPA: hypothetical protein VGG27_14665 [Magnetospirillaceae bacterium]|jgi:hypothetical protein